MIKNYYRILNIGQDASAEQIKQSYRTLAKRYHPDVNRGDAAARRRFDDIHEAYMILSDPDARIAYDEKLAKATAGARITASDLGDVDAMIARRQRENEEKLAQIRFRTAVQQQAQAQAQAQLAKMRDAVYKEGYDKGHKDGYALAEKDLMRVNDDMKSVLAERDAYRKRSREFSTDRTDLESELFARDRQVAELETQVEELQTKLDWFTKASGGNDTLVDMLTASKEKLSDAEKQAATPIASPATALAPLNPEEQNRRLRIRAQIDILNHQIDALIAELRGIEESRKRKLELADNDKILSSMQDRADAWAKKVKADKRLAKDTLYGTLGVLIWATDAEIADSYRKLTARYAARQTEKEYAAKLEKLNAAYAILSDPAKRRKYDESIGCPPARIETERRLIRENDAAQQAYRDKLATREFWARFDELSSLALAGDADAQNALGELYFYGDHVEQDFSQAVYWFQQAFEHKQPAAIYHLGICYRDGSGVPKNESLAQSLLRQADNLGYIPPLY